MVQRKVLPNKVGIKPDHVIKSEKRLLLANMKLSSSSFSSSQHQDGKITSRSAEMKKKMKKSRSIKLSDLEALQSSSPPSRKYSSQNRKKPLVRTTTIDGSPNYMKPTSCSHAKKEIFPVSLIRNTQQQPCSNDLKNLPRKASCVSSKKSAKALARSSSSSLSNLVRTLTKTTSFKASRATCPKKSTRATCSSTLKDSTFPEYIILNPGGTELEGTSVMKVCPYSYCSLNGHRRHTDLPPLKSFLSARRRLLKNQKSMRVEEISTQVLKGPFDAKKDSEVDAKATCDEVGMEDIFVEIYTKEREEDQMGKFEFVKEIEGSGIATAREDLEEDFKESFGDVEVEVNTKETFLHEQDAEEAEERNQTSWSHEEISMGSYCSDDSYDGEQNMKDVEMDDSDSEVTEMEWEEQRICEFGGEGDANSSVFSEEDTDSKVECLSASSHDVSVTWLDDILSSIQEDILAEETIQDANAEEESAVFEEEHGISSVLEGTSGSTVIREIGYSSNGLNFDQSSSTEVSIECLKKAEENGKENEEQVDDEASCDVKKVPYEDTIDNSIQCQKNISDSCNVGETSEEKNSSLENNDESSNEENQDSEEQNTSKNWKGAVRRKRRAEDDYEMRKFNPREPNFLPLDPEPEPEKIDLRHQMMDDRKNAEEWMLDCALRQVVTKLTPARKKKVALLVEAFETVMPTTKCEAHVRNNSAFPHARHVQACS